MVGGNRDVHPAAQPSARLPPGQPTVVRDDERRSAVDDRDDGRARSRRGDEQRQVDVGSGSVLERLVGEPDDVLLLEVDLGRPERSRRRALWSWPGDQLRHDLAGCPFGGGRRRKSPSRVRRRRARERIARAGRVDPAVDGHRAGSPRRLAGATTTAPREAQRQTTSGDPERLERAGSIPPATSAASSSFSFSIARSRKHPAVKLVRPPRAGRSCRDPDEPVRVEQQPATASGKGARSSRRRKSVRSSPATCTQPARREGSAAQPSTSAATPDRRRRRPPSAAGRPRSGS